MDLYKRCTSILLVCKSTSSWIFNSILLALERRDCRQRSQTWQIMRKWFLQIFGNIYSVSMYKGILVRKQWKWKYSKHNVCGEGLSFQLHIFPRKVPSVWRMETELQVERGTEWKRQLDDVLRQFHNRFLNQSSNPILVEYCFSKKYLVA